MNARFLFFLLFLICLKSSSQTDNLIPFRVGTKWGYSNIKGELIIQPIYDMAEPFIDGFGKVYTGDSSTFIKANNEMVIPMEKQMLGDFYKGTCIKAIPKGEDLKMGVIDNTGKVLVPIQYDYITRHDAYFEVTSKNWQGNISTRSTYGIYNSKGQKLIDVEYDWIRFADNGQFVVSKGNTQALFDQTGKQLTPFKYMVIDDHFYNGFSKVREGEKYGFIDSNGKETIPLIYDMCFPFSQGYAVVMIKDKYGIINTQRQLIIPCSYELLNDVQRMVASAKKNGRWGLINIHSKSFTKFEFDDIKRQYNGVIAAKKNNKWTILDNNGTILTGVEFDTINVIENNEQTVRDFGLKKNEYDTGFIVVCVGKKWGIVNHQGKTILKPLYDEVYSFQNGIAMAKQNFKWVLIDMIGNRITPLKYDYLTSEMTGTNILMNYGVLIYGIKQQGVGLLSKNGKELTSKRYQDIRPADDGYFRVFLNQYMGVIDSTGKEIIPAKYNRIAVQHNNSIKDLIFKNGLCVVQLNGKWGYVDKNGFEYFKD